MVTDWLLWLLPIHFTVYKFIGDGTRGGDRMALGLFCIQRKLKLFENIVVPSKAIFFQGHCAGFSSIILTSKMLSGACISWNSNSLGNSKIQGLRVHSKEKMHSHYREKLVKHISHNTLFHHTCYLRFHNNLHSFGLFIVLCQRQTTLLLLQA